MSDALLGTFVSIKTMSDGTPRLTLEMQCTLAEVADMGLLPGVPFALARLTKGASIVPAKEPVSQPKEKPGELCIMACNFCVDPLFIEYVSIGEREPASEETAKEYILGICGINSRKELDANKNAASEFHDSIRKPFLEWKQTHRMVV